MIDVCCAIILKDARILAVQRGPGSSHPYLWEFPGGKIQSGETAEDCIIREIEEELSVQIGIISLVEPVIFDYDTKQIKLIPFVCEITSGEIVLTEHLDKKWFVFDEWTAINWSGADRELIIRNQETLRLLA